MIYTKKALIVDDDAIDGYLIEIHLKKLGFECNIVSSGCEAIESLRHESYNLIILDVMMPIMNGIETANFIRRISSSVPIVLITSINEIISSKDLEENNISNVIMKPIYGSLLKDTLSQIFD